MASWLQNVVMDMWVMMPLGLILFIIVYWVNVNQQEPPKDGDKRE